jgi:hypothetical protein
MLFIGVDLRQASAGSRPELQSKPEISLHLGGGGANTYLRKPVELAIRKYESSE